MRDDIVEIVRKVFAVDGMPIVAYKCLDRRFMRRVLGSGLIVLLKCSVYETILLK